MRRRRRPTRATASSRRAAEELRAQNEELVDACRLLERERAKYLALFADAPEAYLITNARGAISEANAAAAGLLGVGSSSLRGKLLIAFVARQDVRLFRQHLQGMDPRASRKSTLSMRMRRRGGHVFAASLSVRAMHTELGGVVGHLWLVRRSGGDDAALRPALAALADLAGAARSNPGAREARRREKVTMADAVATAIQQAAPAAEARRVRFVAAAAPESLRIDAQSEPLRQAVHLLVNLAASSVPSGGELHVRIGLAEGEAFLELASEGAERLEGSDAEILSIAAQLAVNAGRFELPVESRSLLLCRVTWPASAAEG